LLKYLGALKFRSDPNESTRLARFIRRSFPYSLGITREGILYLLFVFFISMAAVNTGNNLLYIILAVLLSTIVVSGFVSRSSLKQVLLSLQMPENVFVGERVSIKVSMRNLKRIFPSFSISVQDLDLGRALSSHLLAEKLVAPKNRRAGEIPEPDGAVFRQMAYFPILRPGEMRSELTVHSFPKRGLYRLQTFWISTRFPFGFFRRGERFEAKGEVLVYPLIQEISSYFHLLPFLPGHLEGHHVGPGENLLSIRKYQEAESARIIDWKATAKTSELMAREFAREEESKFCLILDTRLHGLDSKSGGEVFEKAVSLAASIAAHFSKEGAGLEFLTPYEYVPRGIGVRHLYRILRSLAVVKYEMASSENPSKLWDYSKFPKIKDTQALRQILSDKVFKIIITSKPKGSFPSAIWRSSHAIFFDEL
jgi:uncharacterized protein (DUF58 family)